MKKVMNCVIRIEYEHDTEGYWGDLDMSEVEDTAAHLAINPNFHSIECGVKIDEVSVNVVDTESPVDWRELKHNPRILLTK